MMFNPDAITNDHIRQAIEKIKLGAEKVKPSTIYDVIIDGERFPPKEVMRIAHGLATGNSVWSLPGGNPTNSLLEKFGFSVMTKASDFSAQRNYWKILPGENSSKWPEFLSHGNMGVSFNEFNTGDLSQYKSLKEIETKIGKENSNNAFSLWSVCYAPEGDVVFANKGRDTVLGIGIISGPYEYHENENMPHTRKVKWISDKQWDYTSGLFASDKKAQTNLFRIDTLSKTNFGAEILNAYILKYPEYEVPFTEAGLWPVYEKTSYDKLISRIAAYKNPELVNAYFEFLKNGFQSANISGDDENLFCSLRKDYIMIGISYKRRYISFLQQVNNKLNLFLMLPLEQLSRFKDLKIIKEGQFGGQGKVPGWIQFELTNNDQLSLELRNSFTEAILNEKKDGRINSWRNVHKNMHNDFIYQAIVDNNFRKKMFEDASKNNLDLDPVLITNGDVHTKSLNTILFGPPGTGKTYKLQNEYFLKYTIHKSLKKRADIVLEWAEKLSWWEAVATGLKFKGNITVPELAENELVKAKIKLSTSKSPRAAMWNILQHHTVKSCENVALEARTEPYIFYKDANSRWSLIADAEEQVPLIKEIYEAIIAPEENSGVVAKNYIMTTFHQNFAYEDFIEGIKPKSSDDEEGQLSYEIQKGLFYSACEKAVQLADYTSLSECISDSKETRKEKLKKAPIFAFFIDEINRANVSSVFGELITLIEDDKRLGADNEITDIMLPYSKTNFGVPLNLHIIGTMNTADRSVEALDTALRRRFSFVEITPLYELPQLQIEVCGVILTDLLKTINNRIEKLLDKDHLIGHSYFLKVTNEESLKLVFANNILPLLQEYFFGDFGKIGLVMGQGFVTSLEKERSDKNIFAAFSDYDSSEFIDRVIYKLVNPMDMDSVEFSLAIEKLMNR